MPQYPTAFFDAVLDKGTLDALMCGDQADTNVDDMLQEASRWVCGTSRCLSDQSAHTLCCSLAGHKPHNRPRSGHIGGCAEGITCACHCRVLRPGGCLIEVTYGSPGSRLPRLGKHTSVAACPTQPIFG